MGWAIGLIISLFYIFTLYICIKKMLLFRKQRNNNQEIYLLLLQWLTMRTDGISMEQKLMDRGAGNIVIYGMDFLGDQLLYELQGSEKIKVVYVVDENPRNASLRVNTKRKIDVLDNVDSIVINDFSVDVDSFKRKQLETNMILLSSLIYD